LLTVDLKNENRLTATVDVPQGVSAMVLFPVKAGAQQVMVNGKAERGRFVEGGKRIAVTVPAGRSEIREE
jgi:hypothetical protein